MTTFVPRRYQAEAEEACLADMRAGKRSLMVLPTGTGKTIVAARIIRRWLAERVGQRAVVVAHRRELIHQARDKLVRAGDFPAYEIGVEMGAERAKSAAVVVVGSVQTLRGRRLESLRPERVGLVVVDEAHHAPAASYVRILKHFGFDLPRNGGKPETELQARVLAGEAGLMGMTATPDRLDGKGLGRWFDTASYVYEIRDAIEDGYLVRIRPRMVFGEDLDLSRIRTRAGDFDKEQLAELMEKNTNLDLVAKATFDRAGDRPTLIFAASIAQSEAVAARLNDLRPGSAAHLDGGTPHEHRAEILRRFAAGEVQYLANVGLFTEGVDLPHVACVAIARPTKSRALYAQMLGRGTRLLGATIEASVFAGKEDLRVLDFVGVTGGRHELVCAVDVLDGNTDEEVRRRAIQRLTAGEEDLQLCLDDVAAEIVRENRLRAMQEVRYRVVAGADPFTILGVRPRSGRYGGRPATAEQRAILERHRIPGAQSLDYGQAVEIVKAIEARYRAKRCTVRQAAQLIRFGLNPDVDLKTASWAMDRIAATRWCSVPDEVRQHPKLKLEDPPEKPPAPAWETWA